MEGRKVPRFVGVSRHEATDFLGENIQSHILSATFVFRTHRGYSYKSKKQHTALYNGVYISTSLLSLDTSHDFKSATMISPVRNKVLIGLSRLVSGLATRAAVEARREFNSATKDGGVARGYTTLI